MGVASDWLTVTIATPCHRTCAIHPRPKNLQLWLKHRWAGGGGNCAKLVTASYDGSVRMLDPSTATFELLVTDPEAEYSAMDCLADASSG